MCGLVMLVHAWGGGLANEVESHTSSERVQAGVGHEGRGYDSGGGGVPGSSRVWS